MNLNLINVMTRAFTLLVLLSLFSCENDDVMKSNIEVPTVRVTTMGLYISQTRGECGLDSNMPVLQFKDESSYKTTVANLKKLTPEERESYMNELGFTSAEQILKAADCEIDSILDIENERSLITAIDEYQNKYKDVLLFNEIDRYDVTPYLRFTDADRKIVGNEIGYVVIGDQLIAPDSCSVYFTDEKSYEEFLDSRSIIPSPIEPGFAEFNGTSFTVKKGKYKSTMTLGRTVNGDWFEIKFVTKKKQFFWYKKVNATHRLYLEMFNSNRSFYHSENVICPSGKKFYIINRPTIHAGKKIDVNITNFTSSKVTTPGSKSFHDVILSYE